MECKRSLDGYFNEVPSPNLVQYSSKVANHCTPVPVKTPESQSNSNFASAVAVTPRTEDGRCKYCNSVRCHNEKYGPYLGDFGLEIFARDFKRGVTTEPCIIDTMFRQRYHILAECERYNEMGGSEIDFEFDDTSKMDDEEIITCKVKQTHACDQK